jgi:GR25 family glycosyltransferase involved in LPS biosynthesis
VINLDRTPDRLLAFARANAGLAYDRFPAIDGVQLGRDAAIAAGAIAPDNTYRPGAVGCAMSHIALWRECAAGAEPFCVAEDDAILRADFANAATRALEGIGDWDIVLWTWNFDMPLQLDLGGGLATAHLLQDLDAIRAPGAVDRFRAARDPALLSPLRGASGTACYSVSPIGAARLLAASLPIGAQPIPAPLQPGVALANTGIDVELSRHYPQLRAFAAVPPLAVTLIDPAATTVQV